MATNSFYRYNGVAQGYMLYSPWNQERRVTVDG